MKNQTKRIDDAVRESDAKKKNKRKRIQDRKEEAPKKKTYQVDTTVWDIINPMRRAAAIAEAKREGDPLDGGYKSDRERMLLNRLRYEKMSIAEAFADAYNLNIQVPNEETIPSDLRVGEIVGLKINKIYPEVTFDSGATKENFITRNNLGKYKNFPVASLNKPVKAVVIEKNTKHTVVDIFQPMVDDFIYPKTKQPWIQNTIDKAYAVIATDLQLVRGGYICKVQIPNVSEFIGEPYYIDGFIPGSQIELNACLDFDKWVGATSVPCHIMNLTTKPGGGFSLVLSRKNFLRNLGAQFMKTAFNDWCDEGEAWKTLSERELKGNITGLINSNNKCGYFVEVPTLNITGFVDVPTEQVTDSGWAYAINDSVTIKLVAFEESKVFNESVQQVQTKPAFEVENGCFKKVNIKPIFKFA